MIVSFKCKKTENLFNDYFVKEFESFERPARRKLLILHKAKSLGDLAMPPGNRPEPLKGDLAGYYSIRINSQWRIIFQWEESKAYNVEIVDYH
jgi:proteic killer suppression protein